ncbi:MAG TPA: hypothetical protein VIM41_05965, partial [Gammaproteobacteria bacterium]
GTPQVRPCRLLWAIPGPHPAGALRATGFAPGESVDGGHPWPQTPPAGNTSTALTMLHTG